MTNHVWPKMMSFCALGLTSGISVRWSVLKAVILVGYISVGVFVFLLSGQGLAATVEEVQKQWKPGPLLQKMLEGPLANVEEIVFAVRVPGRDHWYVTFGNYSDYSETPAKALGFKFEDGVYWGYGEGADCAL